MLKIIEVLRFLQYSLYLQQWMPLELVIFLKVTSIFQEQYCN